MATIINLNLGGDAETVVSYDLVLTAPYEEPAGHLLVLRSRPEVDPVTGAFAITSGNDTASILGSAPNAVDPITGTFAVTSQNDNPSITGTAAYPDITGTFEVTSVADSASVSAENVGIRHRVGYMAGVNADDIGAFEGTYTPKFEGVIAATSRNDTASLQGAFYPYEGPGYLVSDGRTDIAAFEGTNVYDVSGTFAATDTPDVATWRVKTREIFEADPLEDTVLAEEDLIGETAGVSLVDYLLASDLLEEVLDGNFRDTLLATDELTAFLRKSYSLADTVLVSDRLSGMIFGETVDVVLASDELDAGDVPQELSDTIVASDGLISYSQITGILVDTGWVQDFLDSIPLAPVEDALEAADTLDSVVWQHPATFADTVTITDALESPLTVYADLTDGALITDALLSELTLVGVLADTVLAGDSLHEAAQTVLVVNAETGAVSTYLFTPVITSMASYQGVLYLAGPEGLYALDATQDDDGAVVWTLRTGFSNLGTDLLKRVQDCNLQARTEGDTTFQVVSDRYGQKQEWNYRLPPLTRDSYRDGVVKVGRGIQSVYWQFAAQGVGPAEIDQLRLVVEPLSRRR